jgi:L-ascorbate metabolism protein UlaG (beta-lactamase superfamily)
MTIIFFVRCILFSLLFASLVLAAAYAEKKFEEDIFKTSGGDLKITFIRHGTLMLAYDGKIIHVDPVSMYADYSTLPDADLILVTHEHGDHLDPKAIQEIKTPDTVLIANQKAAGNYPDAVVMKNGDSRTALGISIEAVPAYNFDKPFHPKGNGNGYLLTFGDKRVFIAGDTENVPEIKSLKNIDVAFLPMNQPYTMTPEQVADVARSMRPKILYPYHYGNTDTNELVELLKGEKGIEVRIRELQ